MAALHAASAACTVLSGLQLLRPGVTVATAEAKVKGVFLSTKDAEDVAHVLFARADTSTGSQKAPSSTYGLRNLELVKASQLKTVADSWNVDLSRLSQPLLQQLVSLLKLLVGNFPMLSTGVSASRGNIDNCTAHIMMRLASRASAALAALLDKHTDLVLDAAQEATAIGDIVLAALQPSSLRHFPSEHELARRWCFLQARALEQEQRRAASPAGVDAAPSGAVGSSQKANRSRAGSAVSATAMSGAPTQVKSRSCSIISIGSVDESAPVTSEMEQMEPAQIPSGSGVTVGSIVEDNTSVEPPIPPTDSLELPSPPLLLHDAVSMAERRQVAATLARELGLSGIEAAEWLVLRHLEHHAMDVSAARARLIALFGSSLYSALSGSGYYRHDPSWASRGTGDVRVAASAAAAVTGDTPSVAATQQADATTSVSDTTHDITTLTLDELQHVVEHASSADAGPNIGTDNDACVMDVWQLLPSTTTAKTSDASTASLFKALSSVVTSSTCFIESTEEGPLTLAKARGRVGTFSQFHETNAPYLVLSFLDNQLGVGVFERVDPKELRVIKSFYDCDAEAPLQQRMFELDHATCVAALRRVACRLLTEGGLNLTHDAPTMTSWLDFLKLCTGNSVSSAAATAAAETAATNGDAENVKYLCSALLARARGHGTLTSSADGALATAVSDVPPRAALTGVGERAPQGLPALQVPAEISSTDRDGELSMPPRLTTLPPPSARRFASSMSSDAPSPSAAELAQSFPSPRAQTTDVTAHSRDESTELAFAMELDESAAEASQMLPLESTVAQLLIDDVHRSFQQLTSVGTSSGNAAGRGDGSTSRRGCMSGESDHPDNSIVCSSVHPYAAPCRLAGRVDLPEHWRGTVLTFHPHCSTPNSLTTLKLYTSESAYHTNEPSHTFAGNMVSRAAATKGDKDAPTLTAVSCNKYDPLAVPFPASLILSNTHTLFYKFESTQAGSDKPAIQHAALEGHLDTASVPGALGMISASEGPVGLGDDDSLFNLFEPQQPAALDDLVVAIATGGRCTTGTWYFEVKLDSPDLTYSKTQGKHTAVDITSLHTIDALRVGLIGMEEGQEFPQMEAGQKCLLGVAPWSVAYAAPGFTCSDGQLLQCTEDDLMAAAGAWTHGDIIGCVYTVDLNSQTPHGAVTFSRNGHWLPSVPLAFNTNARGQRCARMLPAFSIGSKRAKICPNYGERPFVYAQGIGEMMTSRPLHALGATSGGGAHWEPFCSCPRTNDEETGRLAWGFEFSLQPCQDILTNVTREFNLICTMNAEKDKPGLWFWQPKVPTSLAGRWYPVGDVVTLTAEPPRGAVLVEKGQCCVPTAFLPISTDGTDCTIWRPTGPADFVAMGDVVVSGTAAPEAAALLTKNTCPMLVPRWAVRSAPIGRRLYDGIRVTGEKTKRSVWAVRNGLGTFFGSPVSARIHLVQKNTKDASDVTEVKGGVGEGYALCTPVDSVLTGEWSDEAGALCTPSISWATRLLNFLLHCPRTQDLILQSRTFKILINYLQHAQAPAPMAVVPHLIAMIRLAQCRGVQLPLEAVDPLCRAILLKAAPRNTSSAAVQLSEPLLQLVDLVVEVQHAQVRQRADDELQQWLARVPPLNAAQIAIIRLAIKQETARHGNAAGNWTTGVSAVAEHVLRYIAVVRKYIGRVDLAVPHLRPMMSSDGAGHMSSMIRPNDLAAAGVPTRGASLLVGSVSHGLGPALPPYVQPFVDRTASAPDLDDDDLTVGQPTTSPSMPYAASSLTILTNFERPSSAVAAADPLAQWVAPPRNGSAAMTHMQLRDTYERWFDRPLQSAESLAEEFLILPGKVDQLSVKDTISRRLKMVLSFLVALRAGIDPTQRALEKALFPNREFCPSFPRLIVAKIWYDFASLAVFEECRHPYVISADDATVETAYVDEAAVSGSAATDAASSTTDASISAAGDIADADVKMVICVRHVETGRKTHFKVRGGIRMEKVFDAHELRFLNGAALPGSMVYRMPESKGGAVILKSDTPRGLGLVEGDTIDVCPAHVDRSRSALATSASGDVVGSHVPQELVVRSWQRIRRIFIPGASKIRIFLDRRTALGEGAKLIFRSVEPSEFRVITSKSLVAAGTGDNDSVFKTLEKQLVFTGPEILVTFEVSGGTDGSAPSNKDHKWGWALLAVASADAYEKADVSLRLSSRGSGASSASTSPMSRESLSPLMSRTTAEMTPAAEQALVDDMVALYTRSAPPAVASDTEASALTAEMSPTLLDATARVQQHLSRLVSASGYHMGSLRLPYATEGEVILERPHADHRSQDKRNIIVLLELPQANGSKKVEVVRFDAVDAKNKAKVKISADNVTYHVLIVAPAEESPVDTAPPPLALSPPRPSLTTAEHAPVEVASAGDTAHGTLTTGFPAIDEALNRAASATEPIAAPPLDVWNCPACTFANPSADVICVVCTTPRSGTATVAAPTGAGWWCSVCTFINALDRETCQMCETRREGTATALEGAESSASDQADETGMGEMESEVGRSAAVGSTSVRHVDYPAEETSHKRKLTIPAGDNTVSDKFSAGSSYHDVLVISLRAKLSPEGAYRARLNATMSSREMHTASPSTLPRQLSERLTRWTPEADAVLLEYVGAACAASPEAVQGFYSYTTNASGMLPAKFLEYKYSQALEGFNLLDIQARLLLLGAFNKALDDLLPLVNLHNTDLQSLGAMLRRCNRYVFLHTKQAMLDKIITATTVRAGPNLPATLVLNNLTALASRDNGEIDPSNSQCCFVQGFRQLQNKKPVVYRHIFSSDRVFQITFHGESGIDAGGVFREGVSAMVQDLFSEHFTLFILCPNGQHETHLNCEKYVPNPKCTGPLAISMFEFVGRLMAMSLRAKLMLPFEFPSMLWKKLGGEVPVLADLQAIDAITCQLLHTLQNCAQDGVADQATFADKYGDKLLWTYTGSDGVERELYPGSATRVVTYDARLEYCAALQEVRLHEFDEQVDAIARGFHQVFPERMLQLFTWDQLEILVAGSPVVDLVLWKAQTINGVSGKLFNLFWKVMSSLTTKEQSMFIRFAWGRSRLPPLKEFTTKMRLTPGEGRLPVAHTCFFSVELPEYETEEEMRHGLLTAIHFGVGGVLVT